MLKIWHMQMKISKIKTSDPPLFRTPKLFRIEPVVVKWQPNEVDGFLMETQVFH